LPIRRKATLSPTRGVRGGRLNTSISKKRGRKKGENRFFEKGRGKSKRRSLMWSTVDFCIYKRKKKVFPNSREGKKTSN